jgi:signal transduction histidine kinase
MNLSKTNEQIAAGSVATGPAKTRLSGSRLIVARAVWLALVIPSLGLTFVSFPVYYQQLQRACVDPTMCNFAGALTAKGLRALAALGVSLSGYAAFYTIFWAVIFMIWCGIGFLIFWRRSDDGMALLAAFFLVMFNTGNTTSALSIAYPVLTLPIVLMSLLGQISLWLFLLLFPGGRLVPRWMGLIIPLIIIQAILFVAPSTSPLSANNFPGWLNALLALTTDGSVIISQVIRYRRASTAVERQQTKWVAFAIITVAAGFAVFGLLFNVLFPVVIQSDSLYSLIQIVYPLLLLLFPVCIGIAIMRYRLWDIDIIIKRTLVYGILTACVVGIYVLIVGYLGAVFHTNGNLVISLIATGIVAVLFQPLRDLLQRGINRLLYGQRDEPYVVLAGLGQRLKSTLEPDAVFSTIVETVKEALKLSFVAIEVKEGTSFVQAASSGAPPLKEVLRLPLVYQSNQVGTLIIAPRGRDDALTPADIRLLDDLTQQIGNAVHTVRLTADLQALTGDLQRSREHLVTAREEERRRLRRDLHDGLGPMLSAIMLNIGLVRTIYRRDPETTDTLLNQLEEEIELIIGDIRRVVYNLRPPALDELGLVGAIREYVARLGNEEQASNVALKVTVEAPDSLPPLPAAVEVAAYRIVQEAVTNVIRHALAHSCYVRFQVQDALKIEVSDDGKGIEDADRTGVGLNSMFERAEELGGTLTINKVSPCGTQITACLPLAGEAKAVAHP